MKPLLCLLLLASLLCVQSIPINSHRYQKLKKRAYLSLPSQIQLIEEGSKQFPKLPGGLAEKAKSVASGGLDKLKAAASSAVSNAIGTLKSMATNFVKSVLQKLPLGNLLDGLFSDFLAGPAATESLPPVLPREDPSKCYRRCYGRGQCLENIVKSAESLSGPIFECHCYAGWTGGACQIPADKFFLWAISIGINVTQFTGSLSSTATNPTDAPVSSGYGSEPAATLAPISRPPCCPLCTSMRHAPSRLFGISYHNPFPTNQKCVRLTQEEKIGSHLDPFYGDVSHDSAENNENRISTPLTTSPPLSDDSVPLPGEPTNCSLSTDIERANSECCIYCSVFGFGDEEENREVSKEEEEIMDWANPIDQASPLEPESIAQSVSEETNSILSDTLMRHAWLRHQAREGREDSDDCCVICPYSPTALHVYATQDSTDGINTRRCCPACPTQFVILLNDFNSKTITPTPTSTPTQTLTTPNPILVT